MKTRNLTSVAISVTLFFALFLLAASRANAARLRFHMHCDQTTEWGEDEVYYIVTTKKSDGTSQSFRLPQDGSHTEDTHWNMNDNGKRPDVSVDLLKFDDLKKGERMVVFVTVMEEDGGSPEGWLNFSKALAAKIPANKITTKFTGFLNLMSGFVGLVNVKDTDDYIGSFRIDLAYRESDGYTTAEWSAVERSRPLGQCSGPRSNCFRFDGDGTNYLGWGELFLKND